MTGDWLKPGAVVIDVGINAVDADNKKGYRLGRTLVACVWVWSTSCYQWLSVLRPRCVSVRSL